MQSPDPPEDAGAVAALRGILDRMPRRPDVWVRASQNSDHVGAVLAEAALQAGINYEAVVVPRVRQFVRQFPSASTVSGLLALLASQDTAEVLGIRNARKCRTFRELAELLRAENVETAIDLRRWMGNAGSRAKLLRVHGVGVKTAAYIRLLLGLQGIAIDIHLRRAAADVGVARSDEDLERLFTAAAKLAGIPLDEVDGSLWQRGADRSRQKRRRRAT
jgi:hypothetical protein